MTSERLMALLLPLVARHEVAPDWTTIEVQAFPDDFPPDKGDAAIWRITN